MIAILGGGISGLTAAYHLKQQGKEFILLEAGEKLGGKIQSSQKNGFTIEHGPNTVLINNEEIQALIQQLGLSDELIFADPIASKNRFVLKNNNIEAIPSSISTAFKSQLFGFSTLASILNEPLKAKRSEITEESLANFCRRRFGNQIFEDFITPFVTGIYAGDPEKMSIDYTLNILKQAEEKKGSVLRGMISLMKQKKKENAVLNLPKQKVFTFSNGLYRLVSEIHETIKERVQMNARVISLTHRENQYHLTYEQASIPKTLKVDRVIAALPSHQLAKIMTSISPKLCEALNKIHYVPALAVHLACSTEQVSFSQKAFGILSREAENVPFLGILFNSRFFPHSAPKGKELFSVICGGARYPEIISQSDEDIIEEVSNSVKELLGVKGDFEFQSVVKWNKGIPQYNLGYGKIEATIDHFLDQSPNFHIVANFYKGISVSDCIKNASLIAKSIR